MLLQVLEEEQFSCRSCTDCCRRNYVELFDDEPATIQNLRWPADDPLNSVKGLSHHGGKTYLAHRPDGACVFLNDTNGLCRIHEQFGVEPKPTACRLFPFQITPTFADEASVSTRYDCPTVRKNLGEPHAKALPLIRKYTDKWPSPAGFDDITQCHLDRDQISAVAEFTATMLSGFERNDQRAMFIVYLADVLALTAVDELDRLALASAYAPIKTEVEAIAASPAKKPGWFARMSFRTLLALHLRRDEDVLDRRASRTGRLLGMIKFVVGFGSFAALGLHHPTGSIRRAKTFKSVEQPSAEACALLWRLVRNKLEAFLFLGPANGNRDMLSGLKSLALLYPLVLVAARQHAASRNAKFVEAVDIDYAVAAIEHSFGRAVVLSPLITKPIESLLLDRRMFSRLVRTI